MSLRVGIVTATLALAAAMLLSACGGDDDNNSNPSPSSSVPAGGESETTTTADTPSKSLNIEMGEFYFKPKDVTAAKGKVSITAPNVGNAEHELVLLKTDQNPADLKQKNGEVDEDAYPSPGEIPEVKSGETGKKSVKLESGKYAMICNLPGHYKAGMYGSVTVE